MVKILLGLVLLLIFQFPVFAANIPTLESPQSGSTTSDTSPTLSWSWSGTCAESASCYRVQVDDFSDFSSPNKDYYTSNTNYSPQLSLGTWHWRVKAKDSAGWSDWSQVWNFTISQDSQSSTPTSTATPTTNSPQTSSNFEVSLSEIYPAPNSGEKEWVEVFNPNSQSVDLTNWKFADAAGNKKSLSGAISANSWAYFEYSSGWLNNSGDTVGLLDATGNSVENYSYSEIGKGLAWAKDSGGWLQTSTPTKGAANQITQPERTSTGSSSKSTTSTTTKSTTPTTTPSQVLGKKSVSSGIVSGTKTDENFASPSFNLATISAQESSSEAQFAGIQKSNSGPILLILGGLVILVTVGAKFAKNFKWKL